MEIKKILIVQTAFIGDVILATPLIEKLHKAHPGAKIDFLLRKGNESLFHKHPLLNRVWVWDKKKSKYKALFSIAKEIRKNDYDLLVNLQRFLGTGLLTAFSKAKLKIGFDKNPVSFLFDERIRHDISSNKHEVERNIELINKWTDDEFHSPVLHPSDEDYAAVEQHKKDEYICIAPTSVWFTKQYPANQWISFLNRLSFHGRIYLIGAPSDTRACQEIKSGTTNPLVVNLAGQLSLLQSAALMKDAILNYVNDSAPLHMASAVNAPTCAIFCSTVPAFGFYPLADFSEVIQIKEPLECKPCGLHGYKACPLGHFKCAHDIMDEQLLAVFDKALKQKLN